MVSPISQAAQGLDAGFDRLTQAAGRIARNGAGDDLAGNMVDMLKARQEVRANVAVVRTADEMIGTLLDVLA
jgi:flagellar basal body rod protein FlgC